MFNASVASHNNAMNNLVAAAAAMGESTINGDSPISNTAVMHATATGAATNSAGAFGDVPNRRRGSTDGKDISAAKARRLEQNRRAAIESRKRKKVMAEELQRSVSFYTKANATLAMHNQDLEHRLILAKQHVQDMGLLPTFDTATGTVAAKSNHKTVQEGFNSKYLNVKSEAKSVALPNTMVPPPTLEVNPNSEHPDNNASIAPPAIPATRDQRTSDVDNTQALKPSNEESEDEYIEGLKQFAAQQSAIATAAAASANAAYQAIKYHEMAKANGQTSTARFPVSLFSLPKSNERLLSSRE